eukprot:9382483-Pyramimonas_sp.AAC.1
MVDVVLVRRVTRSAVGARPWNAVPYFVDAIAPCCASPVIVVVWSLTNLVRTAPNRRLAAVRLAAQIARRVVPRAARSAPKSRPSADVCASMPRARSRRWIVLVSLMCVVISVVLSARRRPCSCRAKKKQWGGHSGSGDLGPAAYDAGADVIEPSAR